MPGSNYDNFCIVKCRFGQRYAQRNGDVSNEVSQRIPGTLKNLFKYKFISCIDFLLLHFHNKLEAAEWKNSLPNNGETPCTVSYFCCSVFQGPIPRNWTRSSWTKPCWTMRSQLMQTARHSLLANRLLSKVREPENGGKKLFKLFSSLHFSLWIHQF